MLTDEYRYKILNRVPRESDPIFAILISLHTDPNIFGMSTLIF